MRMQTSYKLKVNSSEMMEYISLNWGDGFKTLDDCSFAGYENNVFAVMERTLKLVHKMEIENHKENFIVLGRCETDYDCSLFVIEYQGEEPNIKAIQIAPEDDESIYYEFLKAEYDEIPMYLEFETSRTFKQAIKEELTLGGFLGKSYEEWVKAILGD